MTPALRALAEFDGWIFSASGNSCQKGRNGTARRITDLHYDRWEWVMPAYARLCSLCVDRERMVAIQSAILLNDVEMAGELCGKAVEELKTEI